jgi:hypothetical protein
LVERQGRFVLNSRSQNRMEGLARMLFEFRIEGHATIQNEHSSASAARNKAGKLAVRHGVMVDLAEAGDDPFADRYITSAMPCKHRESGFRFVRRGD